MVLKRVLVFTFLLLGLSSIAQAQQVILTNKGNATIRLKCEQEHGPYRDIYLKSGESIAAPEMSMSVELVPDYGQWHHEISSNGLFDVIVQEDNKEIGRLRAHGDKIKIREEFFDPDILIKVGRAEPLSETTRERYNEIENELDRSWAYWPWFGGQPPAAVWTLMLLILLPFTLALLRSIARPGFALEGRTYRPFGFIPSLLISISLGIFLSFAASKAAQNTALGGAGFVGLFLKEVALLPLFLFHFIPAKILAGLTESHPHLSIALFWSIVFFFFVHAVGRWRAPSLIFVLFLTAALSALPLWQGFQGAGAYDWMKRYPDIPLYPGAFSTLIGMPLLFLLWLYYQNPYHGYFESYRSDETFVYQSMKSGLFFPVAGFAAGLLIAFTASSQNLLPVESGSLLSKAAEIFGWLPLMAGLPATGGQLLIVLFWLLLCTFTGFSLGRYRARNALVCCVIFSWLSVVYLSASFFPGAELLKFTEHYKVWMNQNELTQPVLLQGSTGKIISRSDTENDFFADEAGTERAFAAGNEALLNPDNL